MATVMIEQPFTFAEEAAALANEAVFTSRNPQLMLRHDPMGIFIIFRNGEYRTSKPNEIEFLLGVVKDEARGNRGVLVRALPTVTLEPGAESMAGQPPSPPPTSTTPSLSAASAPSATPQTRARTPRRTARKRGS